MEIRIDIHVLNIFLMIISLVAAIIIPFELFLIAYAVLGPLHYLTEINWLNKNNFYIKEKTDIWILVVLTFIISIPTLFQDVFQIGFQNSINPLLNILSRTYGTSLIIILVLSIVLVYRQRLANIIILGLLTGLIIFLFRNTELYYLLAGVLLPSIIHVYIFTLIFMVYGLIKKENKFGKLEVLTLAIIPLIITLIPISSDNYILSIQTLRIFKESNFENLNISLGNILGTTSNQDLKAFIFSEIGIKIQIFIAFAYTYHYFNWFSKVSLIGWLKNTSLRKLFILILLWIISISLYFYNYRLGLAILFFLSLLHVTLEFPLNIISIKEVIVFITSRFRYNQ